MTVWYRWTRLSCVRSRQRILTIPYNIISSLLTSQNSTEPVRCFSVAYVQLHRQQLRHRPLPPRLCLLERRRRRRRQQQQLLYVTNNTYFIVTSSFKFATAVRCVVQCRVVGWRCTTSLNCSPMWSPKGQRAQVRAHGMCFLLLSPVGRCSFNTDMPKEARFPRKNVQTAI